VIPISICALGCVLRPTHPLEPCGIDVCYTRSSSSAWHGSTKQHSSKALRRIFGRVSWVEVMRQVSQLTNNPRASASFFLGFAAWTEDRGLGSGSGSQTGVWRARNAVLVLVLSTCFVLRARLAGHCGLWVVQLCTALDAVPRPGRQGPFPQIGEHTGAPSSDWEGVWHFAQKQQIRNGITTGGTPG
jgi:hypothetical protein